MRGGLPWPCTGCCLGDPEQVRKLDKLVGTVCITLRYPSRHSHLCPPGVGIHNWEHRRGRERQVAGSTSVPTLLTLCFNMASSLSYFTSSLHSSRLSSLPSGQSLSPSQVQLLWMQNNFSRQVNSSTLQTSVRFAVVWMPQSISSSPSTQSRK